MNFKNLAKECREAVKHIEKANEFSKEVCTPVSLLLGAHLHGMRSDLLALISEAEKESSLSLEGSRSEE